MLGKSESVDIRIRISLETRIRVSIRVKRRIRIKVKRRIRIRIKIKFRSYEGSKSGPLEGHGLSQWSRRGLKWSRGWSALCMPAVANLQHFDEEHDLDPHQWERSDPDPHQNETHLER
jgi:hypothetical protein